MTHESREVTRLGWFALLAAAIATVPAVAIGASTAAEATPGMSPSAPTEWLCIGIQRIEAEGTFVMREARARRWDTKPIEAGTKLSYFKT